MKIAGSASVPVNISAPTHTRRKGAEWDAREHGQGRSDAEESQDDQDVARQRDCDDQRQQTDNFDARIEALEQAIGLSQFLGEERAFHGRAEPQDCALDEAGAALAAGND